MLRTALLSCLLVIAATQEIWAQNAEPKKAAPPAANGPAKVVPAPSKLTPSMRRTLKRDPSPP